MTKIIKVQPGQCAILDQKNLAEISMISAPSLYQSIGLRFIVKEEHTGGIAVDLNPTQVHEICEKYLQQGRHIDITVTGGDGFHSATQYANSLEQELCALQTSYPTLLGVVTTVNDTIHHNGISLFPEDLI